METYLQSMEDPDFEGNPSVLQMAKNIVARAEVHQGNFTERVISTIREVAKTHNPQRIPIPNRLLPKFKIPTPWCLPDDKYFELSVEYLDDETVHIKLWGLEGEELGANYTGSDGPDPYYFPDPEEWLNQVFFWILYKKEEEPKW